MAEKYHRHLRTIQHYAVEWGLPPKTPWTTREFVERSQKATTAELSQNLGMSLVEVIDRKADLRQEGAEIGYGGFPFSETQDYTENIIRAKADSFIVCGDWEVPDHDAEILEAIADIGEKFGIKDLFLNGDIAAHDWLSDWFKTFAIPSTLDMELGPLEMILEEFVRRFPRIYVDEGNHERRLPHKVFGNMSLHHLVRHKFPHLQWTRYAYMYVTSYGPNGKGDPQKWLICHQDNYSKVPFSVPLELCSINLCHVIAGHNHRLGKVRHKSGKFYAIEGGYCRDAKRTLYKVARKNRHPNWTAGFTMVLEGVPYCIDKDNYRHFMRGIINQKLPKKEAETETETKTETKMTKGTNKPKKVRTKAA